MIARTHTYSTLVIPMRNYLSDQVGNYVSGRPLQPGNSVSADMRHGWMVVPSVVGTIVVEAGAVGLLLLPVAAGWSVRAGFVLILGLLGIFTVIVALAVRRRVRVPCGCFGASSTPAGPGQLLRNGVLAAVAVIGLAGAVFATPASLNSGSVVAAAVGLAAAVVVIRFSDLKTLFTKEIREYR
jgi:Methylamine utilisation protein MauE